MYVCLNKWMKRIGEVNRIFYKMLCRFIVDGWWRVVVGVEKLWRSSENIFIGVGRCMSERLSKRDVFS